MMRKVFGAVGQFTTTHPAVAAGLLIALLLLGLGGASRMSMETDAFTFIRADSPEGVLFDAYDETFGTGQIIVAVQAENILDPEVLAYMERIGTNVSRIGLAITISGVTTILGFSSLLVSDFSIISMFGSATVITVFFSLVGAILMMPAVVALMYRERKFNTTAVSGEAHVCGGDA